MRPLPLLPEACSLDESESARRIEAWRRVQDQAGIGARVRGTALQITFHNCTQVAAELQRLIAAEQDCCSALRWRLTTSAETLTVTISSGDDARTSDVERLAVLFGADL
jgi:hypothetical protein